MINIATVLCIYLKSYFALQSPINDVAGDSMSSLITNFLLEPTWSKILCQVLSGKSLTATN